VKQAGLRELIIACFLNMGKQELTKKMDMNINGEPFGEWSQQVGAVREKNMIEVHFMHV
jgi:hypothetical protein